MNTEFARTALSCVQNWNALAAQAQYRAFDLAALCHVHPKTLRRFFKARLGMTAQLWLDQVRDFEAEKLVACGKRTKEIAYLLGFKHPSDFCHHFKRARGISLKTWKKRFASQPKSPKPPLSTADNV